MNTKKKILVVDDDPDVVEILRYNLNKSGYEVSIADNGQNAISEALLIEPDLILLDVRMPVMNGIDACRELRTKETTNHTPVLFLTADDDELTSLKALDAGGDHFITKPIHPALLISMIRELI